MTARSKSTVVRLVLVALALVPQAVSAAEVRLFSAKSFVQPGDTITIELRADFSDEATLGGGIDIGYDPAVLQFVSFTPEALGDPVFRRAPDEAAGQLSGIAFGDFDGIDDASILVGELVFEVSASAAEEDTSISIGASTGVAGPFVSDVTLEAQALTFRPIVISVSERVLYRDGFEAP